MKHINKIVLLAFFMISFSSFSEKGNNHSPLEMLAIGSQTVGKIKYCMVGSKNPKSFCPTGIDGKDINSGYLDCSGFSKWLFGQVGVNIGDGTVGQQGAISRAGCQMSKNWSTIKAGDLIYWNPTAGTGHVAIATGNVKNGQIEVLQSSSGEGTNISYVPTSKLKGYYSYDCVISKMPKWNSKPFTGSGGISTIIPESNWKYEGGQINFQAMQDDMVNKIKYNYELYLEALLPFMLSFMLIDFLLAMFFKVITVNANLETILSILLRKVMFYSIISYIIYFISDFIEILYNASVSLGGMIGFGTPADMDLLWNKGLIILGNMFKYMAGASFSSIFNWVTPGGVAKSAGLLIMFLIIFFLISGIIIYVICQIFIMKIMFILLLLIGILYLVLGILEPLKQFLSKYISVSIYIFIYSVTVTSISGFIFNELYRIFDNPEILINLGDPIESLSIIMQMILLLYLLSKLPKLVISLVEGRH